MPNLKLTLEYDGTNYHGWQRQTSGVATIQSELEKSIAQVFNRTIESVGASRTDAGVHARGQTANFKVETPLPPDRIQKALNYYLPVDIAVTNVKVVPEDFSSRFSARGKTYVYRVLNRECSSPLSRHFAYHCPFKLSLAKMRAGAKHLIGRHDFRSFCAKASADEERDFKRRVTGISISKNGDYIEFRVCGEAFLYKMVRSIVGTLIDLGRAKIPDPKQIKTILRAKNRAQAGKCAPAHGLCLLEVHY